jgi:glycosyltransferase involved in cell wall biosynthesis
MAAFFFSAFSAKIYPVQISAVIITFNEEKRIANAVRSVDWADEVVVVDSESMDKTREIAAGLGARVITRPWSGFSEQKQFAAEQAVHDRIFSLDADEVVSPELRASILKAKDAGERDAADGYRVSRLAFYAGRPIKHSGWYPDHQLRLYDRRKGRWNGRVVHESVALAAGSTIGTLSGDLLHYTIESVQDHHRLIGERYAPLAAQHMFEAGQRTSPLRIAAAGPSAFLSTYILKMGFLDGLAGLTIARFAAHHAFLKHTILHEMQNSAAPTTERP